jgi:hypothetical protein
MEQGLVCVDEYNRRSTLRVRQCHVLLNPDGSGYLTPRNTSYQSKIQAQSDFFPTFEDFPEAVRQQVGMLRLVDSGAFVPEVGYRVSNNEYWVSVPIPEDTNT